MFSRRGRGDLIRAPSTSPYMYAPAHCFLPPVLKAPEHRRNLNNCTHAILYSALKKQWMEIYTPVVEQCKIEIRMNLKNRSVELRLGVGYIYCLKERIFSKSSEFVWQNSWKQSFGIPTLYCEYIKNIIRDMKTH